jgi:hypothetical protein
VWNGCSLALIRESREVTCGLNGWGSFLGRMECGAVSFGGSIIQSMAGFAGKAMPWAHAMGTMFQATSQLRQGGEAEAIGDSEALQFENRGRMTLAVGSVQAQRLRKATERVRSRQRAVLAASGFQADDATGRAIEDATVLEGSMQEQLAMAQAEDSYRQDMWRASLRRKAGKQERKASMYEAVGTLVNGAISWRDRFGTPETPAPAGGSSGGGGFPPPFEGDWPSQDGIVHPWG